MVKNRDKRKEIKIIYKLKYRDKYKEIKIIYISLCVFYSGLASQIHMNILNQHFSYQICPVYDKKIINRH